MTTWWIKRRQLTSHDDVMDQTETDNESWWRDGSDGDRQLVMMTWRIRRRQTTSRDDVTDQTETDNESWWRDGSDGDRQWVMMTWCYCCVMLAVSFRRKVARKQTKQKQNKAKQTIKTKRNKNRLCHALPAWFDWVKNEFIIYIYYFIYFVLIKINKSAARSTEVYSTVYGIR